MAVTKTILKNTNQETIVKVSGTAGTATISLATDCLAATQALDGATQKVDITCCVVSGLLTSAITVVRNSVPVWAFAGENSAIFDFEGQGFRDSIQNDKDIVVGIAGAEGHIVLTLRKVSGYATKVERAEFGSYDNTSAVGS